MNDKYGAETDLRLLGPRTGNTKSLVSLMKEYLNQYPASYCGDVDTLLEMIYFRYTEYNPVENTGYVNASVG